MWRARAALLSFAGFLGALAACNPAEMARARAAADQAVIAFHESFDAERFGDIGLADEFPAADREKLGALLGAVHRKLGKTTGTKTQGWHVGSFNLRTRVRVVQATTFERGGAVETFTWVVSDGKAQLLGYNINSEDLILR